MFCKTSASVANQLLLCESRWARLVGLERLAVDFRFDGHLKCLADLFTNDLAEPAAILKGLP
jgi:hypothetical protein